MLRMVFFCLLIASAGAHATLDNPLKQLERDGFVELKNPYTTKKTYDHVYQVFDDIVSKAETDSAFAQALIDLEESFQSTDYNQVFCGAPAGCYRNCTMEAQKLDNKKYFQFSAEYFALAQASHGDVLAKYPLLEDFFRTLEAIDRGAKELFKETLKPLEHMRHS